MILDPERTELRFNSEWLGQLDFAELLRLTRTVTVARLLERDDFANAVRGATSRSRCSEFLYPLMQGYDSVAIQADVELGGTDQEFNLLIGPRPPAGVRPGAAGGAHDAADRGTDGVAEDERSRSATTSAIDEPPSEMYGKA